MRSIVAKVVQAALLLAGTASAEPPRHAEDDPEIVVTGTRDNKCAASDFIDSIMRDHDNQLARFHARICPATIGLPEGHAAAVMNRIRDVAATAGLELAGPKCRPNLVVVVADGGRDFVTAFRKKRPRLFHDLRRRETAELFAAGAPARAWQIVERREADGRVAEPFVEGVGYRPEAHLMPHMQSSRLQKSTRSDLALSFVVFDIAGVEGLTLTQLADYAAMRALASTRPPAKPGGPRSILRLFDDPKQGIAPAAVLTKWDLAYLKALYATNGTMMAWQERGRMVRRVRQELAGTGAEPERR
ncbi:MAG TPA: hypothetical protein VF589_05825 [Allosphingosinicella sp.]